MFKLPNNYLKSNNAMDVYNRVNYYYLSDATTQYTTKEDDKIKLRLKLALTYIKFAALILKYIILTQNVMAGASLAENTKKVLAAANVINLFLSIIYLMQDFVFGNATYMLNKNGLMLRKPSSLSVEKDVALLRNYVAKDTKDIVADKLSYFDFHKYVELRDAACTKLTLLNGWHGGKVMFHNFCNFN